MIREKRYNFTKIMQYQQIYLVNTQQQSSIGIFLYCS